MRPKIYDDGLTPQQRYKKKTAVQVLLSLNNRTDTDIIRRLAEVGNKQGYIKRLIREDIARGPDLHE